MSTTKRQPRNQINLVVDDEIREAIDEIRALTRPVPSISDAIRQAIVEKRDRLRRADDVAAVVITERDGVQSHGPLPKIKR